MNSWRIRRYWQDKSTENLKTEEKNYSSTIEVDLPHKPGVLGHITSLIGLNKGNIINLEIIKIPKYIRCIENFNINNHKGYSIYCLDKNLL